MPGTVLGAGDTTVNKIDTVPALKELTVCNDGTGMPTLQKWQ